MESKQFYINRSAELHIRREAALAAVSVVEREIDENIRLLNIAPDVADPEPVEVAAAAPSLAKTDREPDSDPKPFPKPSPKPAATKHAK